MANSALRSRNFVLLVLGQVTSLLGNLSLRFALSMYILEATGSATLFSGLLALSMVPTILLSPFGGMLADRADRRKVMVALDALSGLLVLLAGLALPLGNGIPAIAALLFALSVLAAFESPTVQACVPQMLAGEALLRGKGAILLVPEIALTPQMVSWFRARFGDVAAVLHSALSQGEKYDEWRRIRQGEARVVIGARSAVFAPVESLGLLIVDEEHEGTYRSGTHPCYDAREVARVRCRLQGATLVLGSATPSVETYARTLRGHNVLLEMRERVAGRPLPAVEIVDMRKELIAGNRSMFSRALRDAIEETLLAGQQVVLFHNRRGHSSFVKCRACGYTVHCPHCDVTMTYHSSDETLKCHYCGAVLPPPKTCPACGSPFIRRFGVGTQQVEEKFREEFPAARVLRMDNDTTRGKDDLVRMLTTFRRGEAQVLIGTQMVAKGHDFPGVTLVGVIMADMSLNLPDYRSEEKTFQLLTQVEGRAGRGEKPGRVVVQSYEPEHYAISMAATQDYRAFYEAEITRRRRRLYPPYAVLSRLLVTGRQESDVRAEAELLEMEIDAWFRKDAARRRQMIQVRAMEAPLSRIRDEYRHQVFVKLYAAGSAGALEYLADLARARKTPGLRVELEIDPPSFL